VKAGAKYEQFVFQKLRRLFPEAVVKLNDKIQGRDSKFDREIDVSVRMSVEGTHLLYIVQCKDWASRVDINTLGAFSAVMQDVGAAKGFLLCTSGFYETNHEYALARGIELVTIEDIESDRWNVEAKIPFVYVRKHTNFVVWVGIKANAELVGRSRDREMTIDLPSMLLRATDSSAPLTVEEYIVKRVKDPDVNAREGVKVDLAQPGLEVRIADVWTSCFELSVVLTSTKTRYLKYLTPSQYSQMRDHVRGTTLPLYVAVGGTLTLDSSFVEMAEGEFPSFEGLWVQPPVPIIGETTSLVRLV